MIAVLTKRPPDDAQRDYNQVQNHDENEPKLSHELLAGGASFYAMHEFEEHQRKEGKLTFTFTFTFDALRSLTCITTGKVVNHEFAKELIAGFAGGEVDRLAETKGADYIDREKAKHEAKKRSHQLYDQHYGEDQDYNPERRGPPRHLRETFGNERY